jgi:hypothetical protein
MPAISVWTLVAPGLKSLVHVVFGDNAVMTICKPFAGMARSYRGYPLVLLKGPGFSRQDAAPADRATTACLG